MIRGALATGDLEPGGGTPTIGIVEPGRRAAIGRTPLLSVVEPGRAQ
jgi:hypothetical protein